MCETNSRLAAALVLMLLAGSADSSGVLPPPDCVRQQRLSWQAERNGDLELAIHLMEATSRKYPNEVVPLSELLRLYRADNRERNTGELRNQLTARLLDPQKSVPDGSLRYLIEHADDDPQVLDALRKMLVAREADGSVEESALRARAVLEGRLGLKKEARETLSRFLTPSSTYRELVYAYFLDVELERWDDALKLVESQVDDPRSGPAWLPRYFEVLGKTGQIDRFVQELEGLEQRGDDQLIYEFSSYIGIVKRVAWDLYDRRELESSERLWRRVLSAAPEDIEAQKVVANLFSTEEERSLLTGAVDQQLAQSENPELQFDQGTQYLAAGDYERAFDLLSRAAPALGIEEVPWFNLGLAASRTERWQEATDAFLEALALNPERVDTYFNLGQAQLNLDDCSEAVASLEKGLAADPNRWSFYYYLSGCYRDLGRTSDAELAMREYRSRKPSE